MQALLGRWLRARRGGAVGAALLGSCAFYLAALPFFGATLASDLLWTVALSLAYRAIAKRLEHRRGWVLVPASQVAAI